MFDINEDNNTTPINTSLTYGLPTYEPYEPTINDVKLIINENEKVHENLKQIQNHQSVSAFYPFTVYDSFKNDDLLYSSIESDDYINNISRCKKDPTLQKCGHPKHDEYKGHLKNTIGAFIRLPKRLEACLNIDRGTLMCGRCIYRTDRDPEYTTHKKYISRRSIRKKCELVRLKIDMNF
ncbi:10044_t:CDS:2 [Entrophospora sp. SA101]|nr:7297_t:CDS:2 [Entrophospora sp. SA101]CAJ0908271.1 10044_t:CDS:2 [Entrophospora sp. SA101]